MSILSGQTIRRLCQPTSRRIVSRNLHILGETDINIIEPQDPMITPFVERGVQGGKSYGLSVAGYDIRIDKIKHERFRTLNDDGSWVFRVDPGDFILASSVERIKMPNDVIAFVKDKSSWAREGLALQNTVLEPGWEGFITLELSFHRPSHHLVIRRGDPIAQVIFQYLDEPAEKPYSGKYQNQAAEPVQAIAEQPAKPELTDAQYFEMFEVSDASDVEDIEK